MAYVLVELDEYQRLQDQLALVDQRLFESERDLNMLSAILDKVQAAVENREEKLGGGCSWDCVCAPIAQSTHKNFDPQAYMEDIDVLH